MVARFGRVRVERGVYRQPNGKYAVCFMLDGKPRFRTVDGDLETARSARARLVAAGLDAVRFHDLRHTFASHPIIDLGLDVAQVSRILGHASVTTLNIYTHFFDDARHATEIRTRMASSPFARLLEPDADEADNVVVIARRPARRPRWPSKGPASGRRTTLFAGTSMELGGLEPPTSWVHPRCRPANST